MELVEHADLNSKQAAKGGSLSGQKQKTVEKKKQKGLEGKGFWGCWSLQGVSFTHQRKYYIRCYRHPGEQGKRGSEEGQRQEATERAHEMLHLWCTSSFL